MCTVPRFSQLSPARQVLVRICQTVNFGEIRGVRLHDGDPVLESACVLSGERLDRSAEPRPEIGLNDFELREEWCRLLARLDQIRDGMIMRIEVQAGLPQRIVYRPVYRRYYGDRTARSEHAPPSQTGWPKCCSRSKPATTRRADSSKRILSVRWSNSTSHAGDPRQLMRDGFHAIVSGWMRIDDFDNLTDRIERSSDFVREHGPLEPDEEATANMMIESQIARAIARGDFDL